MATIDERLDRLTERHEALVQYIELTAHENQAQLATIMDAIGKLVFVAESHDRRLGRLESGE